MRRTLVEAGAQAVFDSIERTSGDALFADLSPYEIEAARNLTLSLLTDPDDHPGSLNEAARWMTYLAAPHLETVPSMLRPLLNVSKTDVINGEEAAQPALEQFLTMRLGALGLQTLPKERHTAIAAASSALFIKSCAVLGMVHQEK